MNRFRYSPLALSLCVVGGVRAQSVDLSTPASRSAPRTASTVPDLSSATHRSPSLAGPSLTAPPLTGASLPGASLSAPSLAGASLAGTSLTAPSLVGTPLAGASADQVLSDSNSAQLLPSTPGPSGTTLPIDHCTGARCSPSDPHAAAEKPRPPVHIGPPAQRALSQSQSWAENPNALPALDSGGRVVFPYNQSAPTIVCAPIHVCDIELQEGEVVQGAPHIGDSVRWKVSPALSGSDEHRVTHLIVKPTESGLDTNLIVPTDRHTYHIRLVSSSYRYISSVAFQYPDEQSQSWSSFEHSTGGAGSSSGPGSAELPTVAVNRLNFNYTVKVVKGRPTFKPLRAMDDGYHTYIAMNEDLPQGEAPALLSISPSGAEQIVNYRLKGNLYIIDGTVHKIALISGVGSDQQRVELTRSPCRQKGWLGICWDPKE
jgi:type IV secretion system protein TrbG